jgi:cytochrome c553
VPDFDPQAFQPTLEHDSISELAEADLENGARIYYTGVSNRSGRIDYSSGPDFGGMMPMMNAYLSCAACHGPEGQGGQHVMHMQTMDAPDIRLSALRSHEAEDEHQDEADDDHEESAYGLDTFRQAVIEGQHPDGDPLDSAMPRWELSEQDLIDLLAFLAILP